MVKEAPKVDEVNFVVTIYKGMELDEIEVAYSYQSYEKALAFYNEEVKKAKNNYCVSLSLEIEEDGTLVDAPLLADNYVKE